MSAQKQNVFNAQEIALCAVLLWRQQVVTTFIALQRGYVYYSLERRYYYYTDSRIECNAMLIA